MFSQFWGSDDTRSMSEDARTLALYLLTCQHGTIAGAFPLPDGYACEDLQWTIARVQKGFAELFAKGWANRCETTKWVWIRKHFEWNAPENPNQWKAVHKIAQRIPDKCSWKACFLRVLAYSEHGGDEPEGEPLSNPSETLSKSVSGTVAVTESKNQDRAAEQPAYVPRRTKLTKPDEPDWMPEFRRRYPRRSGSHRWDDARKAANARLAEGHDPETILAGADRYARYCQAAGITGTAMVQQGATFLGTNRGFLEPWDLPQQPRRETAMDRIYAATASANNHDGILTNGH